MNSKDWSKIGKLVTESARKRAFDAGSFISYGENGKVIREYPDGRKTEVIRNENGNRKEIDYTPLMWSAGRYAHEEKK